MNTFFTSIKKHKIITFLVVVIIVGGGYYWYHKTHAVAAAVTYVTTAAAKTTLTVSVTGTGQVSDKNSVDIKPTTSGTITQLNVVAGQSVAEGQTIAVIDESSNTQALNAAKASLASAQANYENVLAGTTSTDIQTAQLSVQSAQLSLDNANTAYASTVTQQQTNVANAESQLLNASLVAQPATSNLSTATVTLGGSYSGTAQGAYNIAINLTGQGYYFSYTGLESGSAPISRGVAMPLGTKGLTITFSTTGTLNLNDSWVVSIPNTLGADFQSATNSYQNALQTQTQQVTQAQQAINSAQLNLQQAQVGLAAKQAPPTDAAVASAEAQLESAQNQVSSAELTYNDNILKAPFAGTIAVVNNHVGDQATSATAIATISTVDKLATISLNEVDVAKIKVGDQATLTFDAIPNLTISGTVADIDTIGAVSQGVVTYTVDIAFDTQDPSVLTGMSVSAAIIEQVAPDVIAVPSAAIKTGASGSYVLILNSTGQPIQTPVVTGISNDTETEITSGLSVGDNVVTQTVNPNAKTTTASTTSAFSLSGLSGGGGGGGFGGGARTGAGATRTTTGAGR